MAMSNFLNLLAITLSTKYTFILRYFQTMMFSKSPAADLLSVGKGFYNHDGGKKAIEMMGRD